MYASIKKYCDSLVLEFETISHERKVILGKISEYIQTKLTDKQSVSLTYICTHNSRRSHFGQIWAAVASNYYAISNVHSFSGGTESTEFNNNAIAALKRVGFKINTLSAGKNAIQLVSFDDGENALECFSKVYDHPKNPQEKFAAIMTCGEAEQNCPFIPNVELRIATTYDDPKLFDGTDLCEEKYDERCRQIALETLYVFSKI